MSRDGVSRDDYLRDPYVKGFVRYLADQLDGKIAFSHEYTVKDKRWVKAQNLEKSKTIRFESLASAYEHYYWRTPDGKHDFASNEVILSKLQRQLHGALAGGKEADTLIAALKILDWGQVYRGAVAWLIDSYERKSLVIDIRRGRDLLTADTSNALSEFDGPLRMDSGLTKVFALASTKSIIYDDRVAAALGLLIRKYLMAMPDSSRPKSVPALLKFVRGTLEAARNPSAEPFVFPTKESGKVHATWNLRANWIAQSALDGCANKSYWNSLRKVEAALFMIGYAVC